MVKIFTKSAIIVAVFCLRLIGGLMPAVEAAGPEIFSLSKIAYELIEQKKAAPDYRAEDHIFFFYGRGCPHCAEEEKFLEKIEEQYPEVEIKKIEVWFNARNAELMSRVGEALKIKIQGVPLTIAGEKTVAGYLDEVTTGQEILRAIGRKTENAEPAKNGRAGLRLPFLGEVDLKKLSLPAITAVIALLDGFNPCALWVLLFLISLLLATNNKKKMLVLGGGFIFVSAAFYFLVLAAWFNVAAVIGYLFWIRLIIGLVAVYAGVRSIREYARSRDESCEVVDEEKRKKIFSRLRVALEKQNLFLSFFGVAAVAVAVNTFELVCSAGLPAVFTQILIMSALPAWQYYAYLVLYSFVFVLNQLVVFLLAFFTMRMKVISPKLIRYVTLIGGIIIFLLGIVIIIQPSWLMIQ